MLLLVILCLEHKIPDRSYGARPFQIAALFLELTFVDFTSGIALAQNIECGLLAQSGFVAAGPAAESTRQRHDDDDDQTPEQKHTDSHAKSSRTKSVITPHHFVLLKRPDKA